MENIYVRELDQFRAQVILEPLKGGFGYTLGNALRRVLLSSMPGSAAVEVIIKGVQHEYSAIEGVQEDVINILLNIKGILFLIKEGNSAEATINFKGPGIITAKDIELPHNLEVLNPDHIIANVTQAKNINILIRVEKGQGYVPASQLKLNNEETKKIGSLEGKSLFIDASFSPIRKVAYNVENARVEQRTDFDKLILDIETNGTILPLDAIKIAARVLQEQLSVFSGVATTPKSIEQAPKTNSILDASIDELELTVRSANALKAEGIASVKDLVSLTENELIALPNLGKKSITEIREALEHHQLNLGMKAETKN